jgi:hypothetical protein
MKKLFAIILFVLAVGAIPGQAQSNRPDWTVNPAAFDTNMDVTIQVFINSAEANSGGMIGAYIDGVIHGVKDGGATSPNGKYVFITRVYGNYGDIAKSISFKYYDTVKDKVYDLTETTPFSADGQTGNALAPVEYHGILGTVATLTDLKVSGTSIAGFSSSTLTYTKELAYGTVVTPTVTVTSTDNQAAKAITNAASLPGSTTIVVTSEDGTANTTYTVSFTIASNVVATLSDLKVSGVTVTGFSASILTYGVSLPHATSTVPSVTATTSDTNATKVITPAGAIPGSTTVVVTAEDRLTTKTYTVNFTLTPDTDATLSDLKVGGTTVAGFSGSTLTYNVVLAHNTSSVPVVTAAATDPNAQNSITQAASVTGSATILVTAEDGTTRKTYTINFSVAPDVDAALSDIKISGTTVTGFAAGTLTYNIALPYGTAVVPTVTAITNDVNATKVITPAASLPGSTTVAVTAEDGTTKRTYSINFTLGPNTVATLSDLKISGTTVTGFSAATLTYNVVLAHNTAAVPAVTATTTDSNATKVITPAASLPGTTTVLVTAEDGTTKKTYSVNFTLAPDTDATLSALMVDGTGVSGFATGTLTYNIVLPHSTGSVPVVTATTNDSNATKTITQAQAMTGTSTVVVRAEDGTTTKTYTLSFSVAPDTDANLSDLKFNSTSVSGFSSSLLNYYVELPYGTVTAPVVTATTNDPNAAKSITQSAGATGTASVLVTAEDGTTRKTYTINFTVTPPSHDATLSELKYNGISVPGFSASTITYAIELPYGTVTLPVLTATTNFVSATKVITNPATLTGAGTVRVTAQDGTTVTTYTINFSVMVKSNDAALKDLTVSGVTVPGFSAATLEYSYKLIYGSTNIPTVGGIVNHANATKTVVQATTNPGTSTVEVTAENGVDKKTYRINFSYELNTDATLRDLRYADVPVPGFNPATLSYTVQVAYETNTPPEISATTTDSKASVLITKPASVPGTATIRVTAENGISVKTYSILIERGAPSAVADLWQIKVDGNILQGFNSATLLYEMKMPCTYIGMPVVTAVATHNFARVTYNHIKGFPGADTIYVVAQDGNTKLKYVLKFTKDNCSSDASLKEIKFNGQAIPGFNPNTLVYDLPLDRSVTTPPTISCESNIDGATITITQATSIPGTITIRVKSTDSATEVVYTINLRYKSVEARLSGILIDGQPYIGFNRDVFTYTLTGLPDKMTLPVFTLQTTNGNALAIVEKQEFKTADGYYKKIIATVTITAEDGVTQLVYTFEMNFALTGVNDLTVSSALDVFPNPSQGRFEVNYTNYTSGGQRIEIKVLDITGRVVYRFNTETAGSLTNLPIDLSNCQPGLYFVRVQSGQDIKIKRVNIN